MTDITLKIVNDVKTRLHFSYSQLNTYISCPLKYKFHYVMGLNPEFLGSGLVLGKSIHDAAASYYRGLVEGESTPESVVSQIFEESVQKYLDESPVSFKKGEDHESMIKKGQELISLFYKKERANRVLFVEQPLEGTIPGTDVAMFGIVDLVEEDDEGNRIIVDLKTSASRYDDFKVQSDQQLTFYAELAKQNGLVSGDETLLRFDVLLKQKTPSLESYYTVRKENERNRLLRVINQVLRCIEKEMFYPSPSWMCPECGFKTQCNEW